MDMYTFDTLRHLTMGAECHKLKVCATYLQVFLETEDLSFPAAHKSCPAFEFVSIDPECDAHQRDSRDCLD